MKRHDRFCRTGSRFVSTCALLLAVVGGVMPASDRLEAQSHTPLDFTAISTGGWGDCMNTYSWSMVWFKDHLYVGTNRGSFLSGLLQLFPFLDPEFNCQEAPNPETGSAAEIWRYSPQDSTWELVFQSPTDVPVIDVPGTFIARDNGFRDMFVFTEADGTEALYAGGVIYLIGNETRQPRILRSTDGVNFEAVPQDPGTLLGSATGLVWPAGTSFRAMASYKGRFYVTLGSVFGEGILLEASDPAGGNDNFRIVSPPGMLAFELISWNDYLYVGQGKLAPFQGLDVVRTDATPNGTPYYDFEPVLTNGANGPYLLGPNNAVLSMKVFQNRLYVGGQSDLFRINPDDSWELVVGTPRTVPGMGEVAPLSGLPGGFGNPFTLHLWRMEAHEGALYVGTWDTATFLRVIPILGLFIDFESGFDLWKTEDGATFTQITRNGLDSKFNHGVRSLQSTPYGLFLGTTNPWNGTEVFMGTPSVPPVPQATAGLQALSSGQQASGSLSPSDRGSARAARRQRVPRVLAPASASAPRLVQIESQGETAVLSWEPSPGAEHYRVFRDAQVPSHEIGVSELLAETWVPTGFALAGTTDQPFYRDDAIESGHRYTYYVQAETAAGQISDSSNVVMVPVLAPPVTFEQLEAELREMGQLEKIRAAGVEARLLRYLAAARAEVERERWSRAKRLLGSIRLRAQRNRRAELNSFAAEDLEMMVTKLIRRVELAESGVIQAQDILAP